MNVQTRLSWRQTALIIAGGLLIIPAALVSNDAMERALLSDTSRTLGWGATLFRALLACHGLALILAAMIWRRSAKRLEGNSTPAFDGRSTLFDSSRKTSRAVWIALIGLSLLALALRLWRLDSDLWHDEVLTLVDFARAPLGEIVTSFPAKNQHMLYSVLARLSFGIFGESAWALRLPSAIFGVGSIWALFLLGRRLVGAREALMACALMTVSYHHVWFSQNARGYMGLLCFTLLATWLWLEALSRNEWSWWLGYAAAAALGAWIQLMMAFVVAAHVLLSLNAVLFGPWNWRPIVAWLLCASLTLQLHALIMPVFLQNGVREVSLPSEWLNPLWVITESLRSLRIGFSGIAVVLCGGVMTVAGWLSLLRRDRRAGLALVLPALLAGGFTLAMGHFLWPRFFFFSMGFALLIVVRGAMALPRLILALPGGLKSDARERLAARAGMALVCLIIAASAATLPRNYRLPKQDFTGARDYVERNRQPGDAVVAVGLAGMDYGRYFAPHWSVAESQSELATIRQAHAKVWLVYTLPIQVKAYRPDIWRVIEREFEVVKIFPGTLGGGEVYVCRR